MAIFRGADIPGYEAGDYIAGTDLADNIKLYAGDDTANGYGGNDVIGGGDGNDSIVGWSGDDRIWGGGGSDNLTGDDGNDAIWGGGGNDVIDGGVNPAQEVPDGTIIRAGSDMLSGGAGDDSIYAGGSNASAWGDSGNDYIYTNGGAQHGGAGNDALTTSSINTDWVVSGNLTMEGGRGADQFYDLAHLDGAAQHTTITDFNQAAGDRVSLGIAVDTPQNGGGYFADTATVFSWLDSNHDGQITGLQADGTGDLAARSDGANLDLFLMDDTLTLQHTAHLDWSMVA